MTRQNPGGLAFFDTNILVYAEDVAFPEKRLKAESLFAAHAKRNTAVVSIQVLQEYFVSATRKLKLPSDVVQRKIEMLTAFTTVIRPEAKDVIAAIELHRLSQLSFWDALILHAARLAGASILYSEDLQPGFVSGGVRVVNPFANEKSRPD